MKKIDYNNIKIKKVSNAIGVIIEGIQLDENLDENTISEIYDIFLKHQVIFFRKQNFKPESLISFAKKIGTPIIYPFVKGLDSFPEITPILKKETDVNNFGGIWHSDTTYQDEPPKGTMLYALEVPEFGGDTEFSNQYLAYDTLSDEMKIFLEKKKALNISAKSKVTKTRSDVLKHSSLGMKNNKLEAVHPVVRTHPETKKRTLYINEAHTTHFIGMSEEESMPILKYLFKHQVNSKFTCRYKWKRGSVAIWDNRCTLHNPINDYQGSRRLMHRITFQGDKPF
jgi:taurine dioxygenase